MIMRYLELLILLFVPLFSGILAQNNQSYSRRAMLETLESTGINLSQQVSVTYDGPLKDLVVFLAESTRLNMTVAATSGSRTVSLSLSDARLKDVILYLCDQYQLDLQFTGSIISFLPAEPAIKPVPNKVLEIDIDSATTRLRLLLQNDTLDKVVQRISQLTGVNIVVDPSVRFLPVNGYVQNAKIEDVLAQLAANNNMNLKKKENYFILEGRKIGNEGAVSAGQSGYSNTSNVRAGLFQIEKIGNDSLSVQVAGAEVLEIVKEGAAQLGVNYIILPDQGGTRSVNTSGYGNGINSGGVVNLQTAAIRFPDMLKEIFKNTGYDFRVENGLYIIGKRSAETIAGYHIYSFKNRTAGGVIKLIPKDYLIDVLIDTMPELNSVILSGAQKSIDNIRLFFDEIDKLIPVILIELILIDVQIDKLTDLGIEAGTIAGGAKPGGAIISSSQDRGGFNFNFSPSAINNLLELLSGKGIINLGQVSSDFYLTLKAVQEDGYISIRSTPKLSTLNSHRANLSIGQSRYFQEQQVTYPGTDRPIPIQANVFREVEANLDIDIVPVLSGDEQVTLDIDFEQSEFIGETAVNTPPPRVKRKFESLIRVRNGEMVVLGGLEYESKSKTRRGVPILSKIPLIGWLFGRTITSKQKNRLLIFVKPTIVN